jgi:hypothetical protein
VETVTWAQVASEPSGTVRLLGAFDAYVLGAGTTAVEIVPAERRAEVSRAGGWDLSGRAARWPGRRRLER